MLLVHQNTGKENRYGKNFFATLISTLGRFNRANKKNPVIYTLRESTYSIENQKKIIKKYLKLQQTEKNLLVIYYAFEPGTLQFSFMCVIHCSLYLG